MTMQHLDLIVSLILFRSVSSITPGPNNLMLLSSGMNFGVRRTIPHLIGVSVGVAFLVLCLGFGLGAVFTAAPSLYTAIKYFGAGHLLCLAFAIATSDVSGKRTNGNERPMTFLQAIGFQWVNPKVWIMATGGLTAYDAVAPYPFNILLIAALSGFIVLAMCSLWVSAGALAHDVLSRPKLMRAFNVMMGILLTISLYPVFVETFRYLVS